MISHFALKPSDTKSGEYGPAKVVFSLIESALVSLADGGIWKIYYIGRLPYQWTSDLKPPNEIFLVTDLDERKMCGIYGTLSDDGSEHFRQLESVIESLVKECGLRREKAIL